MSALETLYGSHFYLVITLETYPHFFPKSRRARCGSGTVLLKGMELAYGLRA